MKQLGLLFGVALLSMTSLSTIAASKQHVRDDALRVGKVFRDCPTCMQMVVIPPGTFMMGSADSDPNKDPDGEEGPQHKVTIGYMLAVGRYEVTRDEYARFVRETGLPDPTGCNVHSPPKWPNVPGVNWHNTVFAQTGRSPAVCVGWDEANAYAKWLSQKTGQTYRLLSESEWEYAARAGSTGQDYWGDSPEQACAYANGPDQTMLDRFPDQKANLTATLPCRDGHVFPAPVGSFKPNAFGLYDMMGNVFEMVQDCWFKTYADAPADGSPHLGGACELRLNRGGSWTSIPGGLRAALRGADKTTTRVTDLGFRLAREIKSTPTAP